MIKKILRSAAFWIIAIELIAAIVLFQCGFRITYSPHLENSWDAISAVAEWVGVIVGAIVVPLAALWIQHKWDIDKQDVAASNLEIIKELTAFKEKFEPLLTDLDEGTVVLNGGSASDCENTPSMSLQERTLQYIAINMGATRTEISEYLNTSMATTSRIIKELIDNGSIESVGVARNRRYKISKRADNT